jgi:hypothetical protein
MGLPTMIGAISHGVVFFMLSLFVLNVKYRPTTETAEKSEKKINDNFENSTDEEFEYEPN